MPGLDDRGGERVDVDLELSPRRLDDCLEYEIGSSKRRRTGGSAKQERFDEVAFRAPADPYTDFAVGLDGAAHGEPGPLTDTGFGYSSALETLRRLESAMGPPTGAGTTADLFPMDPDATPMCPSPSGGETQSLGKLGGNPLNPLPFRLQTSSLSTPAPPPPLFSSTAGVASPHSLASTNFDLFSLLDTPTGVMLGTPQITVTIPGPGTIPECAETASVLMGLDPVDAKEEEIAGPRLFQLLDDNDME